MEIALLQQCRGDLVRDKPPLPPTSRVCFPGGEHCCPWLPGEAVCIERGTPTCGYVLLQLRSHLAFPHLLGFWKLPPALAGVG